MKENVFSSTVYGLNLTQKSHNVDLIHITIFVSKAKKEQKNKNKRGVPARLRADSEYFTERGEGVAWQIFLCDEFEHAHIAGYLLREHDPGQHCDSEAGLVVRGLRATGQERRLHSFLIVSPITLTPWKELGLEGAKETRQGSMSLLVLLDLSATFNILDHLVHNDQHEQEFIKVNYNRRHDSRNPDCAPNMGVFWESMSQNENRGLLHAQLRRSAGQQIQCHFQDTRGNVLTCIIQLVKRLPVPDCYSS